MILPESFHSHECSVLFRDDNCLVVAPHVLLCPYIANYTFTNPQTMPEQQMVLPSVSNTLVYSLEEHGLISGLRGVNTRPTAIGGYARQFHFMFLVEFHPAGLYPFLKIDQSLLRDDGFPFEDLNKMIDRQITGAYFAANSIRELIHRLDHIFLSALDEEAANGALTFSLKKILEHKGTLQTKELAGEVYYSEKQLNRLFQKHVGASVKTVSRVVRVKHALDLLSRPMSLSQAAEQTGHYDPSHFVRDFKTLCGFTPQEYRDNMSLFYNDPFKLNL